MKRSGRDSDAVFSPAEDESPASAQDTPGTGSFRFFPDSQEEEAKAQKIRRTLDNIVQAAGLLEDEGGEDVKEEMDDFTLHAQQSDGSTPPIDEAGAPNAEGGPPAVPTCGPENEFVTHSESIVSHSTSTPVNQVAPLEDGTQISLIAPASPHPSIERPMIGQASGVCADEARCVTHPDALRFFCDSDMVEFCSLCEIHIHFDHKIICAPNRLRVSENDTLTNVLAILRSEQKQYRSVFALINEIRHRWSCQTRDVRRMIESTFTSMLSLFEWAIIARAHSQTQTEDVTTTIERTFSSIMSSLERDKAALLHTVCSADAKLCLPLSEMRLAAFDNAQMRSQQICMVLSKLLQEYRAEHLCD